jgi:hypothetical protein
MSLSNTPSVASSSPQWLVSNAGVTVGPVRTELLLRGVMHGRVPSSSWVRQTSWQRWREVGKIREVCALTRVLERTLDARDPEPSFSEARDAVTQASDAGEALLIALRGAARATSATVGLAHRVREPLLLPTTSCAFEASSELLGHVLPWHDAAFALARRGGLALGPADAGSVERALSSRLGGGRRLMGVAMVPITISGRLCGMLELGRSDHPFRDSDAAALSSFGHHVGVALARLNRAFDLRS